MKAHFVLSKKKVIEQFSKLNNLGVKVSYSVKTNKEVGKILEKETDCFFSVHNIKEGFVDAKRSWFFSQAWSIDDLKEIFEKGYRNFVVDNDKDLETLLTFIKEKNLKINLSLRMKFKENRIHTGKYFVYGMSSRRINKLISEIKENSFIEKLGVHIHRKTQNTSEWTIKKELEEVLEKESLERINFINLGGGYPVKYRNYMSEVQDYIFKRIKETSDWLNTMNIKTFVEPGRFIAAPPVNLVTEIIQIYDHNIILNCSLYNAQIDTLLENIRLLEETELEEGGELYLIKGNTPTRDDIFRYRIRLPKKNVGDKIVFLNAGAYNFWSEFCDLEKIETKVVE
ncbi:decarboxylase [archaeon]|nr:decarboxylase [archaeon]MBL7057245.1 decarboxylase [Candidatus Woesearchaeota archaeon]